MADERELLEALGRGDEKAFRMVVERYHTSLVRVARGYVPTTAVAEEVAQDTWLAVIKGIDRFEGRSSFKTWLFRILINQARTRGEREARSIPMSTMADDDEPVIDASRFHDPGHRNAGHWRSAPSDWGALPDDLMVSAETRLVIDAAIARLPKNLREVITLRDIEGLDSTDVCTLLDLSEGNQRVLLHRARARVRGRLEQHFSEVAS